MNHLDLSTMPLSVIKLSLPVSCITQWIPSKHNAQEWSYPDCVQASDFIEVSQTSQIGCCTLEPCLFTFLVVYGCFCTCQTTYWSATDPFPPQPMPKTGSPFPFSTWEYFIHKATLAGDTDLLCGPTMSCLGALPAVMHQMMLTNLCWLLQLTGISGTRLFPKLYCFIPCHSISL